MKYVILVTFPSGGRWAFSVYDKKFALVPVIGDCVRKAMYWESAQEAQKYLDAQLEAAPGLARLGPFAIETMQLAS